MTCASCWDLCTGMFRLLLSHHQAYSRTDPVYQNVIVHSGIPNDYAFGIPECTIKFWFIVSVFNVNKKVQLDATVCRHLFTAKSLYMFRVSQHPPSGALKPVTAPSGIGHNTGTATSFQRGLIRTDSPDQTTLEGSSCTSVMTYTRCSGYSF